MLILAGKNNIAVHVLEYLLETRGMRKELIGCIFNKNDEGIDGWQLSFKKKALMYGVCNYNIEDLYEYKDVTFISLEFNQLINPQKFHASAKFFNIHFSFLPKYKGMYTSAWPILNDEHFSGVTLHCIDHGIDTGDIIDQVKFEISASETARSLYHKYIYYGTKLVNQYIGSLISGDFSCAHQAVRPSSYYSAKSLNYKNLIIDTHQTADNIHRQLRAFNFREYQYPTIQGVSIIGAQILNAKSRAKAGTMLETTGAFSSLSTIDYDLRVFHLELLDDFFLYCKNDDISNVKKCIELFPEIKYLTWDNGWNCLMVCAYHCSYLCFEYLFDVVLVNMKSYKGTTLLMYAKSGYVKFGNSQILKFILENCSLNVFEKDYAGLTVFDYCKRNQEYEVEKLILSASNKNK